MNIGQFKGRIGGIAVATALGLLVAAGFGVTRLRGDMQTANQPASLKLADPNEGPSKNSFAPIVKKVLPEVVNVSTSKVVKTSADSSGQLPPGMQMDPLDRKSTRLNSSHLGISY